MSDIVLYSTFCPKCNVLKQKLDEKNISYNLNTSIDDMMKLGIKTSPVLSVNGELYLFMDAINWINKQ